MPAKKSGERYDRLYVAIATPMLENGKVDERGMRKFLHYFMQPKFIDAGDTSTSTLAAYPFSLIWSLNSPWGNSSMKLIPS